MALKILGQARPIAATPTTVYPCSLGASSVISTIIVCNTHATIADVVTIHQVLAAGTLGVINCIAMVTIPPMDSFILTAGLTLGSQESIRVLSANGTSSVTVSGDES